MEVLRKTKPIDGLERFSEPILEHAFEYSEIHAREYLTLVDDQEHLEAYAAILDDLARRSWFQLSGLPMGIVQPYTPFAKPLPEQLKLRKIYEQSGRWITEAYRRIAQRQSSIEEAPARRGYRNEIRLWMRDSGLTSIKLAARRLGVSDSILKSIMTNKGRIRYGPETLAEVLRKIGHKSGDQNGD